MTPLQTTSHDAPAKRTQPAEPPFCEFAAPSVGLLAKALPPGGLVAGKHTVLKAVFVMAGTPRRGLPEDSL